MTADTLFDLASLTKVVATLPAVLCLASAGIVSLADPVGRFLSRLKDPPWDQVTLLTLLTHTAGLAATRPAYRTLAGRDAIVAAIARDGLVCRPGTRVEYSDLGYILLGEVVRQASGQELSQFVNETVFRPLGMTGARFSPGEIAGPVAATEVVDGHALKGVVHDENARAMGGVAGHAGLFASLADLVRYLQEWTSMAGALWSPWVKTASLRCYTEGLNGRRALGWVAPGDPHDAFGDFWPLSTRGHTGFTGTSAQFDWVSGVWAILLTNRVHFGRQININPLRRAFHNVAAQAIWLPPALSDGAG
jgi:CubicO group peptidase (beta-lactamase class C family)